MPHPEDAFRLPVVIPFSPHGNLQFLKPLEKLKISGYLLEVYPINADPRLSNTPRHGARAMLKVFQNLSPLFLG